MKNGYDYSKVSDEFRTIRLLQDGHSIGRIADGELKIMRGKASVSQEAHKKLQEEICRVVWDSNILIGIPRIVPELPKFREWDSIYDQPKYISLYNPKIRYASAWITRPDMAPWINCEEYWTLVIDLWRGREVTVVGGSGKGLVPSDMPEAAHVNFISCPRQHAYVAIDEVEAAIGRPELAILCCGATATVLAARLAAKGTQALDFGHMGMFLRRWRKAVALGASGV